MTAPTQTPTTGMTTQEIAAAVLQISNRGETYDGQGTTYLSDWLTEGDTSGMTIEQIAAEWDE